MSLCCSL